MYVHVGTLCILGCFFMEPARDMHTSAFIVLFTVRTCIYVENVLLFVMCSSPERGSMGLRLFSNNQKQSLRREMKSSLSKIVKNIQEEIDNINRTDNEEMNKDDIKLVEFLPVCLRLDKKHIQKYKIHVQYMYSTCIIHLHL